MMKAAIIGPSEVQNMIRKVLIVHNRGETIRFFYGAVTPDEFKDMRRSDDFVLAYIKGKEPMSIPCKITDECHVMLVQE